MSDKKNKFDFKFSYSEKRDMCTCPHRYEIITVRRMPADVDTRRLLLPNVLDQALTEWAGLTFTGPFEDIAIANYRKYCIDNAKTLRWKHPMDMFESETKLRGSANRLEKAMKDHGLCRSDVFAQMYCSNMIELSDHSTLKLTGKLDLLYDAEPLIYDLKLTENPRWLDVEQLVYYDFIISNMLQRKVKRCGFLAPDIDPPVQEIPFVGKEQWAKLFDELNFAIATVKSGQYPDLGDKDKDCFLCFAKWYCKRRFEKNQIAPDNLVQVENRGMKVKL